MATILLVDDDPKVVRRNRAALEASGHDVATVATTAQALDAVRVIDPDVVVLEAMLDGGLAGFGLARTLARRYPTLPLIMVSKVDEHMTPAELATQDHDGGWLPVSRFMEKPVLPAVLVYEVEHALEAAA